jgi:hypothetical protein
LIVIGGERMRHPDKSYLADGWPPDQPDRTGDERG